MFWNNFIDPNTKTLKTAEEIKQSRVMIVTCVWYTMQDVVSFSDGCIYICVKHLKDEDNITLHVVINADGM